MIFSKFDIEKIFSWGGTYKNSTHDNSKKKQKINCDNFNNSTNINNITITSKELNTSSATYIEEKYPSFDNCTKELNINASSFLAILNKSLAQLENDNLQGVGKPKLMYAIRCAIGTAALENDSDIHNFLSKLILSKIQNYDKTDTLAVDNAQLIA